MRPFVFAPASLLMLSACSGGATSDLGAPGHDAGQPSQLGDASGDAPKHGLADARDDVATPEDDGGGSSVADANAGPVVTIRIDAVQTPEGSGASQETPIDQRVGVYGLTLLKTPTDTSPLVVVNHATPIDTPYNAGSSTVIGMVPASQLVPGTYTVARVPVGYVNFTVAGTAHADGTHVAGDFEDLIALTTGVSLNGATRARGWWATSFSVGGVTEAMTTGMDAEIAQPGAGSHLALDLSQPIAAYVFPIQITIPSSITADMEVVFTANTYEDFHWQDQTSPGYDSGVFDVSSTSFEPVTQLGANSCTVTFAPAP
jgi:hypothetical protein